MIDEAAPGSSPAPSAPTTSSVWRLLHRIDVVLLVAVAYLPALASSPGRMPADTKLYLYTDPGGLLSRAASTFEPDQFAGWVPHQQITYLWPSGPWFWMFDAVGMPDWIAHRLWIGTILFAAGAGARWCARQLGFAASAALAAGLVYQMSPYLLPYISRTSLLLLPWAGLGWIVAITVRATRSHTEPDEPMSRWRRRIQPWSNPALVALVVATVGSANATALAMIVPGPVIWLAVVIAQQPRQRRLAIGFAARTALLCLGVSATWIAMLLVQARFGAPVLRYSETLADVSFNSTGSEVLRSLGYWLFYVRDPLGPTTSASLDYLASARLTLVSYAVSLVGLVGIATSSGVLRRFLGLLAATGVVLAVGTHPIDDPSPLMAFLIRDQTSGVGLALRSSTRALPLFVLAIALGTAAFVQHLGTRTFAVGRERPVRAAALAATGVLAFANLPALWNHEYVDDAVDRDHDVPEAWIAAADALTEQGDEYRTLQLPGSEFGAYRWGYTVDQPLVGLAERGLVTRDLLPLGSAGAMDLLYALDDRAQEGTLEVASLAPVARLLSSDTLWLSNDLQYERFRTPRPAVFDDEVTHASGSAGLGDVRRFGEPSLNVPEFPMFDEEHVADPRAGQPVSPVALVDIDQPVPVVRVKSSEVVLSGSGDGIVDAAAAGLIDGTEVIRYSASLDSFADVPFAIVTDANRDRAHHWRGSQDVVGHTEPGGPGIDVLTSTAADQRLAVFDTTDASTQTVAIHDGPVTAIASAYGERFAYLPEHRAVMAIDGDLTTAWMVADHADPVGERIELVAADTVDSIRLVQHGVGEPDGSTRRRIDVVEITAGDVHERVALDASSLSEAGQTVTIPPVASGTAITLRIVSTASDAATPRQEVTGVGFAEIDLGLGPTAEVIRLPNDLTNALSTAPSDGVAIVLTRLRTDPLNHWRSDTEPELVRRFDVPTSEPFDARLTLRLDRRATDDVVAALVDQPQTVANRRLTGSAHHLGSAATDGDPSTMWITPFDDVVGAALQVPLLGPADAPVTALALTQPGLPFSTITEIDISSGGSTVTRAVPPPGPDGVSRVDLTGLDTTDELSVEIVAIAPEFTLDRRFGDQRVVPAALSEIGVQVPVPPPSTVVSATCIEGIVTLDGAPLPVSFATTLGALLDGAAVDAQPCDDPLALDAGTHELRSVGRGTAGLTLDRAVLVSDRVEQSPPGATVTLSVQEPMRRSGTIDGCAQGCWLVHGEGFNTAWAAHVDGVDLGPPQLVDGGFNGWRVGPGDGPRTVTIEWTQQRPVTLGLVIAGITSILCLAFVVLGRRRAAMREFHDAPVLVGTIGRQPRVGLFSTIALAVAAGLLISPFWGLVGAAFATIVAVTSRARWSGAGLLAVVSAVGLASYVAISVVSIVRDERPRPDSGWTLAVDQLNGVAVFSVILLGWAVCLRDRREDHGTNSTPPPPRSRP